MKILVFSDSHSSLQFMRSCIREVKPNAVIHLGDHYDDGACIADENPHLVFYQVSGNCDRYRCPPGVPEILVYPVCGAKLYMTHGHRHSVKTGLYSLLRDARKCAVQVVLYGHTHIPDCHREDDGLWVLNPGSCGYHGGSAGVVEVNDGNITACYLVRQEDLEEIV